MVNAITLSTHVCECYPAWCRRSVMPKVPHSTLPVNKARCGGYIISSHIVIYHVIHDVIYHVIHYAIHHAIHYAITPFTTSFIWSSFLPYSCTTLWSFERSE